MWQIFLRIEAAKEVSRKEWLFLNDVPQPPWGRNLHKGEISDEPFSPQEVLGKMFLPGLALNNVPLARTRFEGLGAWSQAFHMLFLPQSIEDNN